MILTTSDINNIYNVAIISRFSFLFISIISNFLIIDHNSDGFTAPIFASESFNIFDNIIWFLFGGLMRWDAQHFLHIASAGYTYENNLPFFPLFPVIVRNVAFCLKYIFPMNNISSLLISSVFLNSIFFMKASSTLYILTYTLFKNQFFAYYSVLFFCISPATIFFLAPYSESLFSFCIFKGMLKYIQNRYWFSLIWFSVGVFVRSNGIVNVGFILHLFYYYIYVGKFKKIINTLRYMFYSLLSIFGILLPFIAFQIYVYLNFCIAKHKHSPLIYKYAEENNLLMAGHGSIWCNSSIPFSYSYVQDHYWNVGFFRYYTFKQIPNFLLALPIVLLIFSYCGKFLFTNLKLFFYVEQIYKYDENPNYKLSSSLFVFIIHAIYLTIFAIININVQVTTRLIASSSPIIYWIATQEFIKFQDIRDKELELISFSKWIVLFNKKNRKSSCIKFYFLAYAILGTILFSNNYPWT